MLDDCVLSSVVIGGGFSRRAKRDMDSSKLFRRPASVSQVKDLASGAPVRKINLGAILCVVV